MIPNAQVIVEAINSSPLNRGLDGATWLADPANVGVALGDDVAMFDAKGDATFEVHFLFASRGAAAVASAREAFRQMFEDHNAELIFGLTPDDMLHAKIIARQAGGRAAGKMKTPFGLCQVFVLSKELWKGTDQ